MATLEQLCKHESSSMMQNIAQMSAHFSKWEVQYVMMENFAREHVYCTKVSGAESSGSAAHVRTFTIPRTNDRLDGLYLELTVPPLKDYGEGNSAHGYVNALAYRYWTFYDLKVGVNSVAKITSNYLEIISDLRHAPGKLHRRMVFKDEKTSAPNLAANSSRGENIVVYTDLDVPFLRMGALPVQKLLYSEMELELHLRAIKDWTWSWALGVNGTNVPSQSDNTLPLVKSSGSMISWGDVQIRLMYGQVTVGKAESQSLRSVVPDQKYQLVGTDVQTMNTITSDSGLRFTAGSSSYVINQHSLRFPCRSLIWAIGDVNRTSITRNLTTTATLTPYTQGVRVLSGPLAAGNELNVLDDGCDSDSVAKAVKKYDVTSGRGVHLPKDRGDYRITDGGSEMLPFAGLIIKFGSEDRLDVNLPAEYFGLLQPYEHWNNVPRAGIYTYSFDDDSASQNVISPTANLSGIPDVTFEFSTKVASSTDVPLELYFYIEHYQVWTIQNGNMFKQFTH